MRRNTTAAKIMGAWLFFILSFAFPPLLLISVPLLAILIGGSIRQAHHVRKSRDFYLQERSLIEGAKLWGSK